MTGLIIINNAILANLFIEVAITLKKHGHTIFIVTDSNFTLTKYKLDTQGFDDIFVFENFFKKNKTYKKISCYNSWNIHSDFDRNFYYKSVKGEGTYWRKISSNLHSFFEEIYSNNNIDYIYYENISNGLAESAMIVGDKFSIPYYGLTSSRLPGRMLFTDSECKLAKNIINIAAEINLNNLNNETRTYIKNYLTHLVDIQPDYMKTNGLSSINFIKKIFKKRDIKETMTSILYSLKFSNTFQMGNPLIKSYYFNKREVVRTLCAHWLKRKYAKNIEHQNYYIYPLHYHPESSTSILAKYYDEYQLIKNIAFSLSKDDVLFVKDHISANGYEGFDFYKRLLKLPNVKLIGPNVNTKLLIKKSKGVFTLTSTVGYEAALLNKPSIVFGDVFYNEHPLVYKASGYGDIPAAIEFINHPPQIDIDYNEKFVAAYFHQTFSLNVNYLASLSQLQSKSEEIVGHLSQRLK